jgi:sodium/bile acid cotransporter 7
VNLFRSVCPNSTSPWLSFSHFLRRPFACANRIDQDITIAKNFCSPLVPRYNPYLLLDNSTFVFDHIDDSTLYTIKTSCILPRVEILSSQMSIMNTDASQNDSSAVSEHDQHQSGALSCEVTSDAPVASESVDDTNEEAKQVSFEGGHESSSDIKGKSIAVEETPPILSMGKRVCRCLTSFYWTNQFPVHIVLSIGLAKAYPPLGAKYLQPDITATWIAVMIIFVLAGMGLRTEELSRAFQRVYFNTFVQVFNFGLVSLVVFGASRALTAAQIMSEELADGMVITACMPTAINIVIVLSAATGADEAAAIFNSTFGNIIGIFLSPVLILAYLGAAGDISLGTVFYKLTLRVVVPLIFGQIVQKASTLVREYYASHKNLFKKIQESCLVFVVYTVFCKTFEDDVGAGIGDILLMVLFQFLLMTALMVLAWFSLELLFRDEPELRVMGFMGSIMKTVSLGVPMINSIYGGNPNEGLYTLPLLVWHPMQLVLSSMMVPRLSRFIREERKKLDLKEQISNQVLFDLEAQSNDSKTEGSKCDRISNVEDGFEETRS